MENTNTNALINNSSSVKEEKRAAAPPKFARISSISSLNIGREQKFTLTQKIIHFLSRVFSGAIFKRNKTIVCKTAEQSLIITSAEQKKKPVPLATVQAAPGRSTTNAALRKMAEQQFIDMDVSQAPRN